MRLCLSFIMFCLGKIKLVSSSDLNPFGIFRTCIIYDYIIKINIFAKNMIISQDEQTAIKGMTIDGHYRTF